MKGRGPMKPIRVIGAMTDTFSFRPFTLDEIQTFRRLNEEREKSLRPAIGQGHMTSPALVSRIIPGAG
jgi:hypothetical protein